MLCSRLVSSVLWSSASFGRLFVWLVSRLLCGVIWSNVLLGVSVYFCGECVSDVFSSAIDPEVPRPDRGVGRVGRGG